MAASRSFAFEEREFNEASNAQLAPGSVPDFESVCFPVSPCASCCAQQACSAKSADECGARRPHRAAFGLCVYLGRCMQSLPAPRTCYCCTAKTFSIAVAEARQCHRQSFRPVTAEVHEWQFGAIDLGAVSPAIGERFCHAPCHAVVRVVAQQFVATQLNECKPMLQGWWRTERLTNQ